MPTLPASQTYRLIALVLILFLLTGCGGPTRATGQPTSALAPTAWSLSTPEQAIPLPTLTRTPAPTPLPTLDSPIIWYLRGTPPPDLQKVNDRLNQVLAGRGFNARVELRVIERSLFDKQMAQVQAGGQPWDLVSLNKDRYFAWSRRGDLLPLYDPAAGKNLLAQDAHLAWGSLSEADWQTLGRPSAVAAVPNRSNAARSSGISIRADVVRALNLQPQLNQVKTWGDLTPIFAKIQAADKDQSLKALEVAEASRVISIIGQVDLLNPEAAGYDVLAMPFVVRVNDPKAQGVNWFGTPEFKSLAELLQDWRKAGLLPEEPLTLDEADEGYRAGRYLVEVGHQAGPGSTMEQAERYGYEWVDVPIAPFFLSTDDFLASSIGVNARIAADKERVKRVLLLVNDLYSDLEIYNLLAYGLEGQHWNWVDQGQGVVALDAGSGYQPDYRDQIGNARLAYLTDPRQMAFRHAADSIIKTAPRSPALGFNFDPQPVAGQVLAIQGLLPELIDPLANGQVKNVEQAIARLTKALDDAGAKAIEAELTGQWGAWQAAR